MELYLVLSSKPFRLMKTTESIHVLFQGGVKTWLLSSIYVFEIPEEKFDIWRAAQVPIYIAVLWASVLTSSNCGGIETVSGNCESIIDYSVHPRRCRTRIFPFPIR